MRSEVLVSTARTTARALWQRVFWFELARNQKSFMVWFLSVGMIVVAVAAMFPATARDGGLLQAKLALLPIGLREALGMSVVDLRNASSYFALNFLAVSLSGSLYGALLGSSMIAREEQERTAELLYSMPVSRRQTLLGKALATWLLTFALHGLLWCSAVVTLLVVWNGSLQHGVLFELFLAGALRSFAFAGLAMLLVAALPRARTAGNVAMGIVLGSFLLKAVGGLGTSLRWLAKLSLFELGDPSAVANGGLSLLQGCVLVVLGVSATIAAVAHYERKDLYV